MSANRVYISNLNFNTTEDELLEHFKKYEVVSVLIPSQTVRFFRNNQVRPLGIAYAEFPSHEKAQEAIEALNGESLKNRQLRLKPYVPYSPEKVSRKVSKSNAFSNLRKSRKESRDVLISSSGPVETDAAELEEIARPEVLPEASNESSPRASGSQLRNNVCDETVVTTEAVIKTEAANTKVRNGKGKAEDSNSSHPNPPEVVYCNDTIYLGYLPKDIDDLQIRDYLEGYHPNEIWIFRTRPKGKHIQLHRHFMAALVTIKTKENLEDVVESLSKKKFHSKKIIVRRARLSKLKEVQSMADSQSSEQLDVDILPLAENEAEAQQQDMLPAKGAVARSTDCVAAGSAEAHVQEQTEKQDQQQVIAA
ncbi:RRT5 (YFR032C) [Zygosaccharomyces parabailii]|nr:RRT5 (YFR032C) [Zygosaccharomyces parabailii]CDH14368.1 uncharacterized protein ZBAI_06154 [Zygosaccharomyces bailii ISA1307]